MIVRIYGVNGYNDIDFYIEVGKPAPRHEDKIRLTNGVYTRTFDIKTIVMDHIRDIVEVYLDPESEQP